MWLLFSSYGQSPALILTEAQNNKWFDSLSIAPFHTQLQLIKERLLADTNVFVPKNYPDSIKIDDSLGSRVYGAGKPMLVVEDVYVIIDNNTETKKITALAQLLNPKYIESITLLKGTAPQTAAIYGVNGWNGVIQIKLKDNKQVECFRKLAFNQRPIKHPIF